jgi:hypothetical protein
MSAQTILTEQQIGTIKDDTIRRQFIVHNKERIDDISPALSKGMELTETSYRDKILRLFAIYVDADKKKWAVCNVNGLKTLMVQKGITKIGCFGCDVEIQFNQLDDILFIRIYRQIESFFVCCKKCGPDCPTINMSASDAQRFSVGRRGNVLAALEDKKLAGEEEGKIRAEINRKKIGIEKLKELAEELDVELSQLEQINIGKIATLEKVAKHEEVLLVEMDRQSAIINSITETEQQTKALKEQYDTLFAQQFKLSNDVEVVNNSIEQMKKDITDSLKSFEVDFAKKNKDMVQKFTKNLCEKTKEITENLDAMERVSDVVVEKLSYNFRCGVCTCRKNPIWAFDCGHTLCKGCADKLNKCPICSQETVDKRQIYV